jgi:hypothetical protein
MFGGGSVYTAGKRRVTAAVGRGQQQRREQRADGWRTAHAHQPQQLSNEQRQQRSESRNKQAEGLFVMSLIQAYFRTSLHTCGRADLRPPTRSSEPQKKDFETETGQNHTMKMGLERCNGFSIMCESRKNYFLSRDCCNFVVKSELKVRKLSFLFVVF